MNDILFIRHAETDMAGTFCGHSDPELNPKGMNQLTELLQLLRKEDNIDTVYTSDLRRAHTTATTIAREFNVSCHVSSALREINFGQWEGLTWKEIELKDPIYSRLWTKEYPNLPAPGGESFCDFECRVLDKVNRLVTKAETAHSSIAVVAHAGVLRIVLTKLQGYSEELAWTLTKSYCSVVRYTNADAHNETERGKGT
ncbi:MAG: histidine phosphatase family protein [Edaphobacter sp.]